jgi:hypothetical protein
MAYNFLDGHSSFVSNGAVVALPNANVLVNEVRGEAFTNASWKINTHVSLESGARFEYSDIAESGDWPAPGFEDTEFGVFMEPGGGSWRDGSSHESTSLRL